MKHLVIVESPAKAHTIGKILGADYEVMASVGHVADLPDHSLGIRILEDGTKFEPVYEISEDKKKIVASLVKAAKEADEILLASDPDREGEAISWHLERVLREGLGRSADKKTFRRVRYNEITATAVKAAIAAPDTINLDLVNAQQARRLLDRFVGWKVSPTLKRAGIPSSLARTLSAGRVQSVALRMVCEREAEIRAFKPTEYWEFVARLRKQSGSAPFDVRLREMNGKKAEIHDAATAERTTAFLNDAAYTVAAIETTDKARNPGAPFTTSTLQQAASTALGFAPDVTMALAQALYEAGYITYMRTDSRAVSRFAQEAAGKFIGEEWGAEFASPHTYGNRPGAQEAHECIRPTDPFVRPRDIPASVGGDARRGTQAQKLYALIWERFLTSQMKPAQYEVKTVRVRATLGADEAGLTASVSRLTFPGFLQATPERIHGDAYNPNREEVDEDKGGAETGSDALREMPDLGEGEALVAETVLPERKETKPPAHYNEASLVKALEQNGIGRPSTYAATITTLKARKYVRSEKHTLYTTDVGEKISAYLIKIDAKANRLYPEFGGLFYVDYTREMETDLDRVEDASQKLDWQAMLSSFYGNLTKWIEATRRYAPAETVRATLTKFLEVKTWAEPRKVGAKIYTDMKFVQDIANDFMGTPRSGSRKNPAGDTYVFDPSKGPCPDTPISEPQLGTLLFTLTRYKDQVKDLAEFGAAISKNYLPGDEDPDTVAFRASIDELFRRNDDPTQNRIVEILEACGPTEADRKFFESLAEQIHRGRALSSKQAYYLGRMFLSAGHEGRIQGFGPDLCRELGIAWTEPSSVDMGKAKAIVSALADVTDWAEPIHRGKRVFDDKEFFTSVSTQFGAKSRVSDKQLAALEKMLVKYREQVPGADDLIAKYGISVQRRKARAAKKD